MSYVILLFEDQCVIYNLSISVCYNLVHCDYSIIRDSIIYRGGASAPSQEEYNRSRVFQMGHTSVEKAIYSRVIDHYNTICDPEIDSIVG